MKFIIVLVFAIASANAFSVRNGDELIDIAPVMPVLDSSSRITNGSPAKEGQIPYQVGLTLKFPKGSAWCGGSLISKTWILTAAHCTDNDPTITAHLGSTALAGGQSFVVKQIIIHENWNPNTLANDISLLNIDPVTLGGNIQTVPLPNSVYSSYAGRTGVISGWGKTKDDGNVVSTLQYANVPVVENSVCTATYGSTVVKTTNVCVQTSGSKVSTCNGDSGGPLTVGGTLVGVTSYGAAAGCTKEHPVVFTRVSSYRDWIKQKTGE